jgi:hypothetical protein
MRRALGIYKDCLQSGIKTASNIYLAHWIVSLTPLRAFRCRATVSRFMMAFLQHKMAGSTRFT